MSRRGTLFSFIIFFLCLLLCVGIPSISEAGSIRVMCTIPIPQAGYAEATAVRFYYGLGSVGGASEFVQTAREDCEICTVPDGADPPTVRECCVGVIAGLPSCTEVHVGLKAIAGGGRESGWSKYPGTTDNLILKGWPHLAILTPIYTDTGSGATSGAIGVIGENFRPDVQVWVDGTAVVPISVTCTQIDFPVTAGMFFTLVQEEPVMSAAGAGTVTTNYTVQIDPPGEGWRISVFVIDPS